MDNTTADPILEPMAIPYKINQSVDPNLWNGIFALISIFRVDQYILGDAQNIICSLLHITMFIIQVWMEQAHHRWQE